MCFAVSNRLSFLALSPTCSAVLGAYASFADEEGMAFPAREKVAERAGVHISTVSKALRELQAEGLLSAKRRFNSSSVVRLDILAIVARAAANGCKLLLKGAAKVARSTQRAVSKGLSSVATSLWPKPTLTIPINQKDLPSVEIEGLTRYQRDTLLSGRSVLVQGHMLVPGSETFLAAVEALKHTGAPGKC